MVCMTKESSLCLSFYPSCLQISLDRLPPSILKINLAAVLHYSKTVAACIVGQLVYFGVCATPMRATSVGLEPK